MTTSTSCDVSAGAPGRGGLAMLMAVTVVVAMSAALPATAAVTAKPLQIGDAVVTRSLQMYGARAAFSPDGAWVVSTVCDGARIAVEKQDAAAPLRHPGTRGCDLWLYGANGGSPRDLTQAQGSNWGARWSSDGRQLLFISDRDGEPRLWAWDRERDALRRISDARLDTSIMWMPQLSAEGHLLVRLAVAPEGTVAEGAPPPSPPQSGDPKVTPNSTVVVYQSPRPASAPSAGRSEPVDFALVDPAGGQVRKLMRSQSIWHLAVSPDGRQAAYLETSGASAPGSVTSHAYALKVLDLGDGRITPLASDIEQSFPGPPVWSPDSRRLAYLSRDTSVTERREQISVHDSPGGDLWWVAAAGGTPQRFSGAAPNAFVTDVMMPPAWDEAARHVYLLGDKQLWKADTETGQVRQLTRDAHEKRAILAASPGKLWSTGGGRFLWVVARNPDTLAGAFCRVEADSGATHCPLQEAKQYAIGGDLPAVSPDGRRVLYLAEGAQDSPDLWQTDADFRSSRRFSTLNPQLAGYRFGASRLLEFRGHDGRKLKASLLLPTDYKPGKRYPTVVWVYASGMGAPAVNRFGLVGVPAYNMQMLATRGYAVLWPDIPVHTGTPMQDLMKTVMPAIDQAVAEGIVDPDRLAVMGQSNGGYSTLSLVVQSDRFKAAVMNAGFGDLTGFYGAMSGGESAWRPWLESNGGAMGAPPWEAPQRYVDNSPIYQLHRLNTPLIVQAGSADLTIVPFSDQVWVGLQRLGKQATYLRYTGEGHVLSAAANLRDYWTRVLAFFDTHLGQATPPAADTTPSTPP